jgi:hypothetical protein
MAKVKTLKKQQKRTVKTAKEKERKKEIKRTVLKETKISVQYSNYSVQFRLLLNYFF